MPGAGAMYDLRTPEEKEVHVDAWIPGHVHGRLAPSVESDVSAHLLVCDLCFAAWLGELLSGD